MSKVPARDQGNVGVCYSYASASAIDAWRLSNDPLDRFRFFTSPHALAVNVQKNASKNRKRVKNFNVEVGAIPSPLEGNFLGANLRDNVAAAKKYGICNYEAFGSNFDQPASQVDPTLFWSNLTDAYERYHEQLIDALSAQQNEQQVRADIMKNAFEDVRHSLCRSGLSVSANQFVDLKLVADFITAETSQDALWTISSKVCLDHTDALPGDFPDPIAFSADVLPQEFRSVGDRVNVYRKVIEAMTAFKNKQPIEIAYCSQMIKDFTAVGIDPINGTTSKCSGHASLIVGRERLSDGRCGYWIRNSYGTDRDGDHGVVSQLDGRGNILVPEDVLLSNLLDLAVLPPRGETYIPPEDVYKKDPPANQGQGGALYYPQQGWGGYPYPMPPTQPMPPNQPKQ